MEEELREQIQMLNFSNQVHLAGWRRDIPELLKASSMLILPSKWEGMPNVVLETMAAGLPVVATRVGGNPELIRDGREGFLVAPRRSQQLAEALMTLVDDGRLRHRLGLAGRRRVVERFSLQAMVERYQEMYLSA